MLVQSFDSAKLLLRIFSTPLDLLVAVLYILSSPDGKTWSQGCEKLFGKSGTLIVNKAFAVEAAR